MLGFELGWVSCLRQVSQPDNRCDGSQLTQLTVATSILVANPTQLRVGKFSQTEPNSPSERGPSAPVPSNLYENWAGVDIMYYSDGKRRRQSLV